MKHKVVISFSVLILCIVIIGGALWFFSGYFSLFWSEPPAAIPAESSEVGTNTAGGFIVQQPKNPVVNFLTLPDGFVLEVFADELSGSSISVPGPNSGPRMMIERSGAVYVSVMRQGEVVVLHDADADAYVEKRTTFLEGLRNPHGLATDKGWVYIAEEDRVIRVKDSDGDHLPELETLEEIVSLPMGLGHFTRTIKIFDNHLYISIGSSCNVCEEREPERSTIQKCELDGTSCKTYASGLRNAVDFIQFQGEIFATENGRDNIGNNIPPDEINRIQEGKNYGWPACFGKQVRDVTYQSSLDCTQTEPSFVDLKAHIAPLGIEVYSGNQFPDAYRNIFFIASHGSWNRTPPSGYDVFTLNPVTKEVTPFITGFLDEQIVRGRPVGVLQYLNSLLISDDNAGRIYRVVYTD